MKSRTLTQSGSAFLDCIRFATAICVFLGHIVFIPGSERFLRLAHIAVCIFFVLSGFVIRMIATTRVGTMRGFLIDRASRIYSVVVPALLITVLCEGIARLANPVAYARVASVFPWSQVPLQMAANLTFMAQNWGYEFNPLSNSPFWSLSFECIYYILFALLFYGFKRSHGARRYSMGLLAILVMLLAGPSIVLLFPTWLAGCVLYDVYLWLDGKPYAFSLASALLVLVAGGALLLRRQLGWLMQENDIFHRTAWLQGFFSPSMRRHLGDSSGIVPWLSRFSFSFYVAAFLVFFLMLWGLITLDRFLPEIPDRFARTLRWIAEGTFALYLLHLPLLLLISALFNNRPRLPYLWAAGVVLFCILLSRSFDRLKLAMRTWLRAVFSPRVPVN